MSTTILTITCKSDVRVLYREGPDGSARSTWFKSSTDHRSFIACVLTDSLIRHPGGVGWALQFVSFGNAHEWRYEDKYTCM